MSSLHTFLDNTGEMYLLRKLYSVKAMELQRKVSHFVG